jgi:hypothetical protein
MIVVVPTVAVVRAGLGVVSDCAGNGTSGVWGKIEGSARPTVIDQIVGQRQLG